MMTNYNFRLFTFLMLLPFLGMSQVDVTLKVDMTGQSVSGDGVHVVGSINGWCTDCTTLTQEGSSDIYSATVQLSQGWHRFKFLNGNAWGTEESAGYPCAPTNGDRFFYVNDSGANITLETLPFGGCNPSGSGFEVTFNVDMSSEASISPDGVHMAGWHTDWNPGVLALPNVDANIVSGTLRLPTPSDYPIEFQYKFLNGNAWGTDETPGPESDCATVVGADRLITLTNSGENVYDVFNGCTYTLNTTESVLNTLVIFYNSFDRVVEFSNVNQDISLPNIEVFDMRGRLVKTLSQIDDLQDVKIDFSDNSKGLYFVKVTTHTSKIVKKLMVY